MGTLPCLHCLLRSLGTGSGAEEEEAPLKSRYGRDLVVADGVNLDSDPEQDPDLKPQIPASRPQPRSSRPASTSSANLRYQVWKYYFFMSCKYFSASSPRSGA